MKDVDLTFVTPISEGVMDTGNVFVGQITVTTSGTVVQGPDVTSPRGFLVTPYTTNSGYSWVMPHGGSKTTQAYPIGVGVQSFLNVYDLNQADFNCDTNANIICWMKA